MSGIILTLIVNDGTEYLPCASFSLSWYLLDVAALYLAKLFLLLHAYQ